MAEVALEDQEPFNCPICLDPLESPVTIPCGHNYCMACIKDYWNEREHTQTYSCPECREVFKQRPALNKNTMFAEVVERFQKAKLRDPSPGNCKHGKCSGCKEEKAQTSKPCSHGYSCCEPHSTNLRAKHTVIVVGGEPPKNICLQHNMPLDVYCRSDQQLICSLCWEERHRGHDAVSVGASNTERQVDQTSHENTRERHHRHGHRSHEKRKHKHRRHRSGHGTGHRKSLHSRSGGHPTGHHQSHGHAEGGVHTGAGRHGGWHRSSRHHQSGH
ncbi:E3 ubiquitin/ISG15 ligase TRIM25 [Hoplias malabaricus]|uniref:E3 ubiquitin/ISG15 ligase TRIM25 n=1 Tax=Hoplias malabaricus TaxID=27720 RepID=UPI003461F902